MCSTPHEKDVLAYAVTAQSERRCQAYTNSRTRTNSFMVTSLPLTNAQSEKSIDTLSGDGLAVYSVPQYAREQESYVAHKIGG